MDDFADDGLRRLLAERPSAVVATHAQHGDATASVDPDRVFEVLQFLRDDDELRFDMLVDLCVVDYLGQTPRFEVVYHLCSLEQGRRLRVKARLPEDAPELDSVGELFASAGWMEREAFDLFGVRFRLHPRLERILLDDAFQGHPLRKDYPKGRRQPLAAG